MTDKKIEKRMLKRAPWMGLFFFSLFSLVVLSKSLAKASVFIFSPLSLKRPAKPVSPKDASYNAAPCGASGQMDCPLQGWMKSNMVTALKTQNWEQLFSHFNALAHMPEQNSFMADVSVYPHWSSISLDALYAVAHQNLVGVKSACRSCHQQYKDVYVAKHRNLPMMTQAELR